LMHGETPAFAHAVRLARLCDGQRGQRRGQTVQNRNAWAAFAHPAGPYDKLSPRKRQNAAALRGTKPWPSEFPGQRMAQ